MSRDDKVSQNDFFIFSRNDDKEEPGFVLAPQPMADYYKMDHPKRGVAVIFNHMNFTIPNCPRREGTNKDRDALRNVLNLLDFDVVTHNDLTANEVKGVLQTVQNMDHSSSDCLVIVVLSHGDSGVLYARDSAYPTSLLWNMFTSNNCSSLAAKPKLFFIQACRGTDCDSGTAVSYDVDQIDSSHEAYYTIPVMADILVMYSTTEGFYSWRNPEYGSYFIQSLAEQLEMNYNKRDLLTILTFVNRQVAVCYSLEDTSHPDLKTTKQMGSIVSMLTRIVFFGKKIHK